MWFPCFQSQSAANTAWLLYDVALLNSGFQIEDNGDFSSRIYSIMKE
jgi:HSP90 family molecular chaperone